MKKSITNYKISNNFYLYEFIESQGLTGNGSDLNWKYINSLTETERGCFVQLIEMACLKLEEIRKFANSELNSNNIGIRISTGFRCLEYELSKGRSGKSQHCEKIAVDFTLTNITNDKVYDNLMNACYLYIDGAKGNRWMSGLARLLDSERKRKWRFIHIDFRIAEDKHLKRGYGARWEY